MGDRAAVEPAPACISAINGKCTIPNGLSPGFLGENVFIHKNYTDFRPLMGDMNVAQDERFEGFKSYNEKTPSQQAKQREIHYQYKENRYDLKGDEIETPLQKAQYEAQLSSESRLYIQKPIKANHIQEKRGIITNVSRKSSNRLKKFLASITDLGLWIDFTFPDDVMIGKTLAQRRDFATQCLMKLKRFIHRIGLKEIWKKEFTTRKSGKLKGLYLPHYHIALAGLSPKQAKNWQSTCIMILSKWVQIIGTDDDNALVVACHKKSFRRIHCSKQAIAYIGKYFSKTNEVEDENGEIISIGRAWGYAAVLRDEIPPPIHLFLNKDQAIKFRRFVRKYKKLTRNKKFIGPYEQNIKGYSTFLFADETTILRFLMSIDVDIMQDSGIPF